MNATNGLITLQSTKSIFRDSQIKTPSSEIGVRRGGSLELWKKYLAKAQQLLEWTLTKAVPSCRTMGLISIVGDQSDQGFLEEILNNHPTLDIIR